MRKDIRIVCSWCSENMGHEQGWGVQKISHSICTECLADWYRLRGQGTRAPTKHAHGLMIPAVTS